MSIFTTLVILVAAVVAALVISYRVYCGRRARRFGYPTQADYIQAAPHTDAEKHDAVDQALKGLVICIVGLLLPPLWLLGLVPLFIGGRKALLVSMGLGLVDDADPTET